MHDSSTSTPSETAAEVDASAKPILLTSPQMASFVARGFLRFDGVVPAEFNDRFVKDAGTINVSEDTPARRRARASTLTRDSALPTVTPGTHFLDAYPESTTLGAIVRLPVVAGAIKSLVGARAAIDHHFLHMRYPPGFFGEPSAARAQHTHQDSTIDPRTNTFDIQLFYFPHEITRRMGGTRFVPGSHLRVVSESAIARYQNVVGQQHVTCPPGTVLIMHHGIWHGAGTNASDQVRYMFKIRLMPTAPQVRLWDTSDLSDADDVQRPIFFVNASREPTHIHSILTALEPWFEADTGRIEFINRIRLWRTLLGDASFDADFWVTRVENALIAESPATR